jgi:hypothetical protein
MLRKYREVNGVDNKGNRFLRNVGIRYTRLHGVTFQKTANFIFTAVESVALIQEGVSVK